jgi:hypothetical protein
MTLFLDEMTINPAIQQEACHPAEEPEEEAG